MSAIWFRSKNILPFHMKRVNFPQREFDKHTVCFIQFLTNEI